LFFDDGQIAAFEVDLKNNFVVLNEVPAFVRVGFAGIGVEIVGIPRR
jgi:hypothetical protein